MNSTRTSLDLLASRVQELEASNRRWKLVNALLALSAVSVALMGAKSADRIEPPVVRAGTVEAQEFILKDEAGHAHARPTLYPQRPKKMRERNTYFISSDSPASPGQPGPQFLGDKGKVVLSRSPEPGLRPVK